NSFHSLPLVQVCNLDQWVCLVAYRHKLQTCASVGIPRNREWAVLRQTGVAETYVIGKKVGPFDSAQGPIFVLKSLLTISAHPANCRPVPFLLPTEHPVQRLFPSSPSAFQGYGQSPLPALQR